MKTVEKAKVVASVWVKEFIQFLAPLTVLPRTTLKNGMNSSFSFNHPGGTHPIIQKRPRQNSQRGKELNKLSPPPQTETTIFSLSSVSSSMPPGLSHCAYKLCSL